jgi:paraquat-inducible protein B
MAAAGEPVLSEPRERPEPDEPVPAARIRRRRWLPSLVWLVPIAAAVVGGYLLYERMQERGPAITISFDDASGVREGQTELRHRGVAVGRVESMRLSADLKQALLSVRLHREAGGLAREGAVFWIVRPEVRFGDISRLGTIVSGPFLEVRPGSGQARLDFTGLDRAPLAERPGLRLILASSQLGPVRRDSPVVYRGIEVGTVADIDLSRDGTTGQVEAVIYRRYTRLVRVGSRFWTLGDIEVKASLFKGLEVDVDSVRSLFTGGVGFATPENPNMPPARNGMTFVLHDKPEPDWLRWAPKISVRESE